jgi:hypothetical protein
MSKIRVAKAKWAKPSVAKTKISQLDNMILYHAKLPFANAARLLSKIYIDLHQSSQLADQNCLKHRSLKVL